MIVFAPQAIRSPPREDLAHERVRLELLQDVVDGELDVAVLEPGDEADRDHVVAHRVDERAAELAVLRPALRSGQPIVWMIRSSGFATFQTSLTPSAQTCGCVPSRPKCVDRRAGQVPLRALGEHGDPRDDVRAGLEVRRARSPSRPRPLSPVRTPWTRPSATSSFVGRRLRQRYGAARLGLLGRGTGRARETETTQLPWLRIVGGGGMRTDVAAW